MADPSEVNPADPVVLTVTVRLDARMVGMFDDFGDDDDLEMVAMGLADEYIHPANCVADFTDLGDADNWTAVFSYQDRETPWPK